MSFCELVENMQQRGDTTFIDLLNDLRIGELKPEHIAIFIEKVDKNLSGNFAIGKALRMEPTNALVDEHNKQALRYHEDTLIGQWVRRGQGLWESTQTENPAGCLAARA